jgi:hypothetical protein
MLNGRELRLSHGRHDLLRSWGNPEFGGSREMTPSQTTGEIILCLYAESDELKALRAMTEEERADAVTDFLLANECDIERVREGIRERIESIRAAAIESESPGKREEHIHAD